MNVAKDFKAFARVVVGLAALLIAGCSTDQTWRTDGFGVSFSASSVMLIYGEINKIPPGGYFKHVKAVDMRPLWERVLFAPTTNVVYYSTVELDAKDVKAEEKEK